MESVQKNYKKIDNIFLVVLCYNIIIILYT